MIDLTGKKALVTGAGRGIGKDIALTLAKAGADVGGCDIDLDAMRSTAEEIKQCGRNSFAARTDVSNAGEVATLMSSFREALGGIDILVNNAGITRDGLLVRLKEQDWDAVIAVNLKSAYLCCKEVMRPMMKARSGRIVNIASVVGLMGNAGQVNYGASKAGLLGLTKSLAREVAARGITVNAVAPGFIKSAMTDKLSEEDKQKLSSQIPMATLGTPRDVAHAVLFLSSELAAYVTGQVLAVDGGLVM